MGAIYISTMAWHTVRVKVTKVIERQGKITLKNSWLFKKLGRTREKKIIEIN